MMKIVEKNQKIINQTMDMNSRNQYLKRLREDYLHASKKDKSRLLDEAEKRTGLERIYLSKKLRPKSNLDKLPTERKKRRQAYNKEVVAALARVWEIFDHPCGQRLAPLLETETERLRLLNELNCTDEVTRKLKRISPRSIDTKLQHEKEVLLIKQRYQKRINPLLYQSIPVKVFSEQNRESLGWIQMDLVEHCGASASGEYLHTLSTTDISTGWWEGEILLDKGQLATTEGINEAKKRYPFSWQGMHSDNGREFINAHLCAYGAKNQIELSRSRPYKKNDNCLVEQKNKTHVKKFVGYHRYDTQEEFDILSCLYRNELRLFKNFFQPVIKLVKKERINSRIHRVYDKPKTPYARVMRSTAITKETKEKLRSLYESLNPAELKRNIDKKLSALYDVYRRKNNQLTKVEIGKKIKPAMMSFFIAHRDQVSLS